MRKVFCILFSFTFLPLSYVTAIDDSSAKSDTVAQSSTKTNKEANNNQTSNKNSKKHDNVQVEVTSDDYVQFKDLEGILSNKYVQESVRVLQSKMLNLLRSIHASYKKENVIKDIKGNTDDIDYAKKRTDYLISLESNLDQANTLMRIKNLLGLNSEGKKALSDVLDMIDYLENVNTISDIKKISHLNPQAVELLTTYEELKQAVTEADTIDKIGKIPGITDKVIEEIASIKTDLDTIQHLTNLNEVVNCNLMNEDLKAQSEDLLNLKANIKNAYSIDKLKKIEDVNPKLIEDVEEQIQENKDLTQKIESMSDNNVKLEKTLESTASENEKERRYSNILIAVLIRALTGFDYRDNKFNFKTTKDLKVPDKAALIVASKTNLNNLGGSEETLYSIVNILHNVLKTVLTNKDWTQQSHSIKTQLEKAYDLCSNLNNDGDAIKRNIDFAAQIIANLLDGGKRPPKDTLPSLEEQMKQELKAAKQKQD